MKDFQFILSDGTTTETLLHSPIGSDNIGLTFERGELYDSVMNEYTLSFKYVVRKGYGGDFIYQRFIEKGYETVIYLTINVKNTDTEAYELYYTGVLDFNPDRGYGYKSNATGVYFEVGTINRSKLAKFKARDEQKVNVYSTETLDGGTCAVIDEQLTRFEGVPIYFTSEDYETYTNNTITTHEDYTAVEALYTGYGNVLTNDTEDTSTGDLATGMDEETVSSFFFRLNSSSTYWQIVTTGACKLTLYAKYQLIVTKNSIDTTYDIINWSKVVEYTGGTQIEDINFTNYLHKIIENDTFSDVKYLVTLKYKLESGSNPATVSGSLLTGSIDAPTTYFYTFKNKIGGETINPSDVDITANQIGNTIYKPSVNSDVLIENTDINDIVYKINQTFVDYIRIMPDTFFATFAGTLVTRELTISHGIVFKLVNSSGTVLATYNNLATTTLTGVIEKNYSLSNSALQFEVTISPTEKLLRQEVFNITATRNIKSVANTRNARIKINAFAESEPGAATETYTVWALELGKKLIEKITGETNQNKLLEFRITDDYNLQYLADCRILNGYKLRGFQENNLSCSLDDWFKSMRGIFFLGLGYDYTNDIFYLTDKKNLYKQTEIYDLGEVSDYSEEIYKNCFFNSIECGIEDISYEAFQGANEYAQLMNWANGVPVKQSLNVVSPFRTDTIGNEFCRRRNSLQYSSTDTKFDNEVFMVNCQWLYGLKWFPRLNYDSAIGFEGISEYFNLAYNPRLSINRWLPYIKAQMRLSTNQFLNVEEHSKNKAVSLAEDGIVFKGIFDKFEQEIEDVQPLHGFMQQTFKGKWSNVIKNAILAEPHGYFSFKIKSESGDLVTKRGFLKRVEANEINNLATYTLIECMTVAVNQLTESDGAWYTEESENQLTE